MLRFIMADLRRQRVGVAAIALIVALATALGVVVTLQERALRLGSARAADAFDLVVGAPGSETQLVLSAVFLQTAPLPLLPGRVLAGLIADPRVGWAAPVGFGDFDDGRPIVGTTQALVDGLGGVVAGRGLRSLGDAVAGALVPTAIGGTVRPVHGQRERAGEFHAGVAYTVVGRLAPTGTPWDRAVLVPIETVWHLHVHHDGSEAASAGHDDHDDAIDPATPIRPDAVADSGAPGVPAVVVKPRTIADAYRLRQEYRTDRTLAVFPGEVLTRLYGTLGDARTVLSAVAAGAQALVGAAILLVVMVHVLQRRRQIGALRAFGAPRPVVFAIVWLETFAVAGAGLLAGFGIGYLAARLVSARLAAVSGVTLPVEFRTDDLLVLAALLVLGAGVSMVPAVLAYRQSPAGALRG